MTATATHAYAAVDVPVAGGTLRAGVWEPARGGSAPTVLAVHGITASHRAWSDVVVALPDHRVVAPDLRGRGRSNRLPGPYGMAAHAADLVAVLRTVVPDGGPVTVLGHSMGGFVSVVLAHRFPELVTRLVLVDGGVPLPAPALPDGATHDEVLAALLGPAVERLSRTFPSREAYRAFWRAHPAFASWTPTVEEYVDYDLEAVPGHGGEASAWRPSSSPDAVGADSLELFEGGPLLAALAGPDPVRLPMTLLRAPRGLMDEPGGMYPPGHVERWAERLPTLTHRDVAGVNHYTIIMSPPGTEAVAEEISTVKEDR